VGDLRDPEIEQLDLLAAITPEDEDVLGLDVAMDEALGVRMGQPLEDLADQLDHAKRRHRLGHDLREVFALEAFHHQVAPSVFGRAEVHDADAVGMVETRSRGRLSIEARHHLVVGRQLTVQQLERDVLFQPEVVRFEDRSHRAVTENRVESEPIREGLAKKLVGRVGPDVWRGEAHLDRV